MEVKLCDDNSNRPTVINSYIRKKKASECLSERRAAVVPGGGSFSLTSCLVVSVEGASGFLMP